MKIKNIILIIFSIIVVIILFKFIFYPSYLSVASACGQISEEELNELGFIIAGNTKIENGNITIEIFVEDVDNRVKKHELTHVLQIRSGIPSLSCDTPIQKFFGEVQANIYENIPDKIFKKYIINF